MAKPKKIILGHKIAPSEVMAVVESALEKHGKTLMDLSQVTHIPRMTFWRMGNESPTVTLETLLRIWDGLIRLKIPAEVKF